jgi:hypothetical protein
VPLALPLLAAACSTPKAAPAARPPCPARQARSVRSSNALLLRREARRMQLSSRSAALRAAAQPANACRSRCRRRSLWARCSPWNVCWTSSGTQGSAAGTASAGRSTSRVAAAPGWPAHAFRCRAARLLEGERRTSGVRGRGAALASPPSDADDELDAAPRPRSCHAWLV